MIKLVYTCKIRSSQSILRINFVIRLKGFGEFDYLGNSDVIG